MLREDGVSAKYVVWKAEESGRPEGRGCFRRVLRCMKRADNYWLFSDSKEKTGMHGERHH